MWASPPTHRVPLDGRWRSTSSQRTSPIAQPAVTPCWFNDEGPLLLSTKTRPDRGSPILIKSSSVQRAGTSSSSCGPRARTKEVAVQILIVNFSLDGLSEEEFASSCDELAPAFAAVPGL